MKITQILKRRGRLNEIRFDDGTYILLDRQFFLESGLKEDDDISEEKADSLEAESDFLRCKNRAMYYLSGGDYTEKTMLQKLKAAGFEQEYVYKTVIRLKELGLINDLRFAVRFIERAREKNLSEREIKEKAMLKGVPGDILREVLDSGETDEVERIKALLLGKYANKLNDEESSEKVIAALIRKGFKFSDVRTAVREITE